MIGIGGRRRSHPRGGCVRCAAVRCAAVHCGAVQSGRGEGRLGSRLQRCRCSRWLSGSRHLRDRAGRVSPSLLASEQRQREHRDERTPSKSLPWSTHHPSVRAMLLSTRDTRNVTRGFSGPRVFARQQPKDPGAGQAGSVKRPESDAAALSVRIRQVRARTNLLAQNASEEPRLEVPRLESLYAPRSANAVAQQRDEVACDGGGRMAFRTEPVGCPVQRTKER